MEEDVVIQLGSIMPYNEGLMLSFAELRRELKKIEKGHPEYDYHAVSFQDYCLNVYGLRKETPEEKAIREQKSIDAQKQTELNAATRFAKKHGFKLVPIEEATT